MNWLGRITLLLGTSGLVAGEPPVPRRHLVEIRGMAFHPAVLEVARGDTVAWTNRDIVGHTATARSGWDTGVIAQGAQAVIVSRSRGEFRYICTLHPTMLGTLITR